MTDFLHDAQDRTESWQRRHSPEAILQLGVWRWKGIQKHAGTILDLICGKRVIDFGGSDGPLRFGSIIVDQKSEYKTLCDVPGDVDVIFTSHTLEHLDDVEGWLRQARERVNANGVLVIHIPAWTCERWRADQYDNPMQPNRHRHTFCLARDAIPGYCAIDKLLAESDWNVAADYCGDDSIFLIARKQ